MSKIRESLPLNFKQAINLIEERARPLLARTSNIAINFTDHSLDHSQGTEKIYDEILLDVCILSELERYLLLAATLLHDTGMVGREGEGVEEIRDAHHIRSAEHIRNNAGHYGLNRQDSELIARIAEGHRKIALEGIPESVPYGIGDAIRLRLLVALIRLADELHVTNDRATELVCETLKPNKESSIHHERHQSILGVIRRNDEIIISGDIQDWTIETALKEMLQEIISKLESVKGIFESNNILLRNITPQFNVDKLIRKEIILHLAKKSDSMIGITSALNGRNLADVQQEIERLKALRIIQIDKSDLCSLRTDETAFRTCFNELFGTIREVDYTRSPYIRQNIGNIIDSMSLERYGHKLTPGDLEDKVLLAAHSPTVLKNILHQDKLSEDYGQLDRVIVLDLLILSGYMNDVAKFPELIAEKELVFAAQTLANSLHRNTGSFLRLLQYAKRDKAREYYEKMTQKEASGNEDSKSNPMGSSNFTVSFPIKKDTLAHTDFGTLLYAAQQTNQSVSFSRGVSVKFDDDNGVIDDPIVSLTIVPSESVNPVFKGETWASVHEDKVNRILTFEVNRDGSFHDYPILFSMTLNNLHSMNANFRISPLASATQILDFYKMLQLMNDLHYRRVVVTDNNGHEAGRSSCPSIQYNISDELIEMAEIIATWEKDLGYKIGLPFLGSKELFKQIMSLGSIWTGLNSEEKKDRFEKLVQHSQKTKTTFTVLRCTDSEAAMSRISISHTPWWMDYSVFDFNVGQAQKADLSALLKRHGGLKISGSISLIPEIYWNHLSDMDSDKSLLSKVFAAINQCSTGFSRSDIDIVFHEPYQSVWEHNQYVEVLVRPVSLERVELENFLANEQFIEAIPLLEKLHYQPESLAYAYAIKGDYDKAIELANSLIALDIGTVAHMTKGLALVGKGLYRESYEAYLLGVHACRFDWHPVARDNLLRFLQKSGISDDGYVPRILNELDSPRAPLSNKSKCYCGSKKNFKNCHGKIISIPHGK